MDEEGLMRTRISYITKITSKLKLTQSTNKLPTATEQALFEEAITYVLHVVTTHQVEGTCRPNFSPSTKSMDRKQCLKKILDQLHWMERNRLYDPPPDNEIQHYLLIKKYTRSIMAFHLAYRTEKYDSIVFGCLSLFMTLQYVEDLKELNRHFADWTNSVLDMNTEDVSITPMMSAKEGYKIGSKIHGSKEWNYMFFHHKFQLALVDMRSSEFALCPPLKDEERCYVQVLNAISSSSIEIEDETNIYSKELLNLYLDMIHREIVDMEKNFAKIKAWILKRLSLTDLWEVVADQSDAIYYDDNELAVFQKKLIEKSAVSNENMTDYISQVDQCVHIAFIVEAFICPCMSNKPSYNLFKSVRNWKKSAWEFVYALNVLKFGCFAGSVLQEQPISHDNQNLSAHSQNHASKKKEHICLTSGSHENVIILENIIDDLRCIGDSNIALNDEEMALIHKIWGSVASSIHFFGSAMAYEKKRHLIDQYKTIGVSSLKFPTTMPVEVDSTMLTWKQLYLEEGVANFAQKLKAYHMGLIEKLRSS